MAKGKRGSSDRKVTDAKAGKRSRFVSAPPLPNAFKAAARAAGEQQFLDADMPKGTMRWDETRGRMIRGTKPTARERRQAAEAEAKAAA